MKKTGSYSDLLKPRALRGLLSLSGKGYFVEKGWLKSYLTKQPVDKNNAPIPWLTYSFLDFIEGRLNKSLTLFEYGAGNSTLYFSKQIKKVRSIENDKEWLEKIQQQMPSNVSISFFPLSDHIYERAILQEAIDYDIVLIDGRERLACLRHAIQKLSPTGVIILDDSEREKYKEAFAIMADAGFKHIPFSGIAIGAIHNKCTSVFYRADNCLCI